MSVALVREAKEDLIARGYSRRQFGRVSALLGIGAVVSTGALTVPGRSAFAAPNHAEMASRPDLAGMVRIGSNECWTGPFPAAATAGAEMVLQGNRYEPSDLRQRLLDNVAAVEKVPVSHILPWPGSSDPLARAIVSFCSPTRGVVTADPTFEEAWVTAAWLKIKVSKVPLRPDNHYATDVKAMLAADPNAGLYYVCSPNNPTGTVTPVADIAWLVENKPAGSIVLVDEAYLHFAGTPSAAYLAAQGKDVVVLRTFSKIFGMAGLRLGLSMARPDLHERMMRYDGRMQSGALSVVALAAGGASILMASDIVNRRQEMIDARETTFAHLKSRGITHLPSNANMFMVDWGKPAAEMKTAFAAQQIAIGRDWTIWPTRSRITVGSASEMKSFCNALDKITV
ncbi:MAG: pyridoxal phosphate-dependent aminotransferase [Janthinobacterium lividum]